MIEIKYGDEVCWLSKLILTIKLDYNAACSYFAYYKEAIIYKIIAWKCKEMFSLSY